MRKASQLKKFIPFSILIHAGAIFAAGLAAAPLILNNQPSVEVELGTGDSEHAETLGVDVIATQGDFKESTPATNEVANDNSVATLPPEKIKAPEAAIKPALVSAKITATKVSALETPATPAQTASETIQTEDLSITSNPVETPSEVSPEVVNDIASAIPINEIKETTPTQAPVPKEVSLQEEKKNESAPAITASTTSSAQTNNAEKAAPAVNASDKGSEGTQSSLASKESSGDGAGTNGVNAPSQQLAGSVNGVKSLEQIRQKPGNPKPRYDRDERLRGDKGVVVFKAYINNAGSPVKIEKITSSGHQNLDAKSEKALLKWKFESGQEGWVEVPFKWELRGDALESGGTLRRSAANPVETP